MRADVAGEVGQDLGSNIVEPCAYFFHDVHDVGAGLTDDVDRDAGVSERADEAPLLGVTDLDGRDVADVDGLAVADRHNAREDFLRRFVLTDDAHAVVALALTDRAG